MAGRLYLIILVVHLTSSGCVSVPLPGKLEEMDDRRRFGDPTAPIVGDDRPGPRPPYAPPGDPRCRNNYGPYGQAGGYPGTTARPSRLPEGKSWGNLWLRTGAMGLVDGVAKDRGTYRDRTTAGGDAGAKDGAPFLGAGLGISVRLRGGDFLTPYVGLQESVVSSKLQGSWNITDVHGGLQYNSNLGGVVSPHFAADVGYAHWEGQSSSEEKGPANHHGITIGGRIGCGFFVRPWLSLELQFIYRGFFSGGEHYDAHWLGGTFGLNFHL